MQTKNFGLEEKVRASTSTCTRKRKKMTNSEKVKNMLAISREEGTSLQTQDVALKGLE